MSQRIAVVYYNGRIFNGSEGETFEGRKKSLHIKCKSSFMDMMMKIRDKLKLGNNQVISRVHFRFPATYNPIRYDTLEICDDADVRVMMDAFSQQTLMTMLELYVDIDEAGSSSMPVSTNLTNTQMVLTNEWGSHVEEPVVEPESSHLGATINLAEDDDYCETDNVHSEDEDGPGEDSSDTDIEGGPASPILPNTNAETHDVIPFWNSSAHYSYIDWEHQDQEIDFFPGLDVHGSWQIGEELYVGLRFETKRDVQMALKHYSFKLNQTYRVDESKAKYFTASCPNSEDECPWRMRAMLSKKLNKWVISRWGGPHTCVNPMRNQDHTKLTSDFMCSYILGLVRDHPTVPISLIQERISAEIHYKVSYRKAWKAKQKALEQAFGNWEDSYDELPRWLEHMLLFSPGSYYTIMLDNYVDLDGVFDGRFRTFRRVFWTFKQCCDAFNFCKPIIQIDGTFLYGKYKGTLLIATTQDGNNNILPIAFAIVEGESQSSWSWFLRLIRQHVTQKQGICLISDRHAGIISAVRDASNGWQPPSAYHVYCIRHIASNFNHKFKNTELKKELIGLGYEPCSYHFERGLVNFRESSAAVRVWIDRIRKETWSLACDNEGRRFGHMTTNLSEAVNKVLKGARNLPITALVKCTYSRLVNYFVQRGTAARNDLANGKRYCNKVTKALRKNQEVACSHIVQSYNINRDRFEVEEAFSPMTHRIGYRWWVRLDLRSCECGQFQAYRYPCSHAMAACASQAIDYHQFVDPAYSIQSVINAYQAEWYPMGNDLNIPPSTGPRIVPDPRTVRGKGRPKSTRIRNEMDLRESQIRQRPPSQHR